MLGQFGFLVALSCCYFVVVWPGMHGPHVLDDWWNLQSLADITTWREIWTYTFSGTAGSLGRPVTLFTFALQAESWGVSTFPFKLVNTSIHLLNCFLLYMCAYLCASLIGVVGKKRLLFASLCACLWVFLPIHTTTIFYVVQRMTLLSGTFTLLGILGFLYGVVISQRGTDKSGLLIASLGMIAGYFFGVFSKENAIMLGVFVAVLYVSIVRGQLTSNRRLWDSWILVFAVFPLILLFTYISWGGKFLKGYGHREFTLMERLLTESRILWDYFFKIIIPSPERINIYNDDYQISRGLFDPVSTVVSGFFWLILLGLSWAYRLRFPFFLLAISWFIGGHILESTFLPLELYFEHRNYIPSVGVIIAGVWGLFYVWGRVELNGKTFTKIASLTLLAVYMIWHVGVFYTETQTWKNRSTLNVSALKDRPFSFRVNQAAAGYLADKGDIQQATYLLYALDKHWPGYPSTYVYLLYVQCVDSNVVIPSHEELKERFTKGRYDDILASKLFFNIQKIKQRGACPKLSWGDFRYWVSALMSNPNFPKYGPKQNFLKLLMISYITEGDYSSAVAVLDGIKFSELRLSTIRLKMEILMLQNRDDEALLLIRKVYDRFKGKIRLWGAQGHYFENAEQEILDKKGKIKRLYELN